MLNINFNLKFKIKIKHLNFKLSKKKKTPFNIDIYFLHCFLTFMSKNCVEQLK